MIQGLDRRTLGAMLLVMCALTVVANVQARAEQSAAALNGVPVFQADPKWPVLPPDWSWGQVIGIFADSRGHVWTSSRSRISEWDPQGKLLQSWDARGPEGNWSTIHGLFVDHNGYVWTNARESHLTVKFTRTGKVASGNIFVAEAAGPSVKHPVTGENVDAGYRAQKFTFTGTRPR